MPAAFPLSGRSGAPALCMCCATGKKTEHAAIWNVVSVRAAQRVCKVQKSGSVPLNIVNRQRNRLLSQRHLPVPE